MLDHMGMHFTEDSLLGNFAVIFFGTIDHAGRRKRLLQLAEAVMESDRKSNMHYLIPVFATLDPKTDDVIKMNAMVEDYANALNRKDILHVRLKGVSGEDNFKLHKAAQSYTSKVKAKQGASTIPTSQDVGDFYFVNPEGEFVASYGPDADPKAVGQEWAEVMKAYKLSHPSWKGPKAVKARAA
jgi:cytochrome oxidase Cu insertion factor (SCO1/SenC/PrrC family)